MILDGLTAGTSDLQSAGLVSAEALDAITTDVNNLESQLFTPRRLVQPSLIFGTLIGVELALGHGSSQRACTSWVAVCADPAPAHNSRPASHGTAASQPGASARSGGHPASQSGRSRRADSSDGNYKREMLMAQMMDQAADGVWLVTGTDVNWVLVADGDEVTLVDTGEPRDWPRVLASLQRIGRALGDVSAVVLTHAHPDHIGAAERLRADRGIPVRLLATEAPHARGQVIQEAPALRVLRAAWRPRVLLWVLRIVRAGATRAERLTEVKPFDAESGPLDVPGRLVPVPTPGHTSGHCAFHLPGRGVLITGDALITAHPAGRTTGPQLCPPMFNHDEATALASLQPLAGLSADVVLPGHGPAYRGSPASAVQRALAAHR